MNIAKLVALSQEHTIKLAPGDPVILNAANGFLEGKPVDEQLLGFGSSFLEVLTAACCNSQLVWFTLQLRLGWTGPWQ